jgi:peptidoglycan/LPS O-acetylase OafA/YrhL
VSAAIDLLKAFAILAVLWQHTVPNDTTDDVLGNLWIRAAVPIFVVLLGLNLMRAVRRRGPVALDRAGLRAYLRRRAARLVPPLLLVLIAAYVAGAVTRDFDASPALLFGGLPVDAPGNYFIPALIGLVLLFPFLAAAFRRRPVATVLACFAVNAAFELVLLGVVGKDSGAIDSILYSGNPLRGLGAFALGMWLAADPRPRAARNRWLLAAAAASGAYLVAEQAAPGSFTFFPNNFIEVTNLLAAPWAAALVMAGLTLLPRQVTNLPGRALALVGAASYHVFLVQMLVIGVVVTGLAGFALSIVLGVAFFWLLPAHLGGASAAPDWARRPWTAHPPTPAAG